MAKLYFWDLSVGHNGVYGWEKGPNSAGGCSVRFSFKNETGEVIKYASFLFTPYNAVGDVVKCSITNKSLDGVRYTGPVAIGDTVKFCIWENAWYNHTISEVKLSHVYIEYMNGTKEKIEGSNIIYNKPTGAGSAGGGCYVATCVYGSYDCPEVWTLRRYRDDTLGSTWYGKAFIRIYYKVSPTLVKWFGHTNWFKKMWKGKLDKMVKKLQEKGVENTPYEDKEW